MIGLSLGEEFERKDEIYPNIGNKIEDRRRSREICSFSFFSIGQIFKKCPRPPVKYSMLIILNRHGDRIEP
jgi:hypothetical protein